MRGVLPEGTRALARSRARAAPTPWAESWAVAWRALLASRLLVLAAGAFAAAAFGLDARHTAFDPAGLTTGYGPVGDALVAPLARWDSVWYLAIAAHGYGDGAREAFFPLYPLVIRVAGTVTGSPLVGGALASTALAGAGLTVLHRLVALDFGPHVARGAVVATAFFPTSFFLSAVYSESLFLALSVGAIYAARTDRWAWAGVLGGLAAATRSSGLVLLLPLALLWWAPPARRQRDARDLTWLALVPAGLGAYCLFLWLDGGDPSAPFAAQEVWYRSFAGPFGGVWDGAVAAFDGARQLLSGSREPVYFTAAGGDPFLAARHNIELFAWLLAALPAVVVAVRRLPLAYSGYVVASLALPLSWPVGPQPLMSLPRFLLVLFPLSIAVSLWAQRGPRRGPVLLALGVVGLAVYSGIFATWHWTA
jgi:Mannosyltransferase (PIG-V)